MFAYAVAALFALTALLVALSLTDSAMRARRAFRRLALERRNMDAFASDVVVTVVRPGTEAATNVVKLPSRKPADAIRALRPLAAAA
ncbi:hypothetical protein [Altererythrobacter lutimaris]|uniref:Uncharacterized protein n=1 Tax=Altererythrobacter lutimaris TaxID=2743979 RepID=A0A850HAB0_9SPHN|nr:hypothetical protein [Altererythrobacter lutimaris]NVE94420.1 hypothetical protein [Altererythrobacter lutimaris]